MDHIEIANKWREHNKEHAGDGVVLIWAGEVYGWKNCLRDAQHERPGAIAVDGVRLENGKYPTLSLFFVQIASRVYGDS
ncbi:hypothetical protein [Serratia liquefaciens]|uniref:hypothetical protein n=1 Tax=Serratia liquefaciens TaxID=614 RepID=UPI0021C609E9|nr:hypothetical protein [Serratia liquefaciens]